MGPRLPPASRGAAPPPPPLLPPLVLRLLIQRVRGSVLGCVVSDLHSLPRRSRAVLGLYWPSCLLTISKLMFLTQTSFLKCRLLPPAAYSAAAWDA